MKELIQKHINKFSTNDKKYFSVILLLVVTLMIAENILKSEPVLSEQLSKDISTIIPRGYVLIPIDVINSDKLDSVFGDFGVVNVYSTSLDFSKPNKLLAKKVKMIRAPKNPSHFAILCPEIKSHLLIQNTGPFFVAIQNPKELGTEIVTEKLSRIYWENE